MKFSEQYFSWNRGLVRDCHVSNRRFEEVVLRTSNSKGIKNIGADLLSRNGRAKFIREFRGMVPQPAEIPAALRPMVVRARYW